MLTILLVTAAEAKDQGYKVGAGDVLEIRVYGEPTLSGSFPVGEDGHLDYPLLGPVTVTGLTAAEVATTLTEHLSAGYIMDPDVSAWLGSYQSQPVQVLGSVAQPGQYFLKGATTVLQLLSEAGGVQNGGVNEIRVTHAAQAGAVSVIDYERLVSEGADNITLTAGDVVFVPESLVYVMGQIDAPGEIAFREGLTVANCLAAAGGALPTANLGKVYILRGDDRIRVNVRHVLSGKTPDVAVEAGDRIYVGESIF